MCIIWCISAGMFVFFFKQKTAYEMRISDWSSDVCSSDLGLFRDDQLRQDLQRGDEPIPCRRIVGQDDVTGLFAAGVEALGAHRFQHVAVADLRRSEERRVGKECVSTCRSRWAPHH